VAIGMDCEARLAERLGRVGGDLVTRQASLLEALGLPRKPPAIKATADDLLAIMARDKKSLGGRLRFVLPTRIGHVELVGDVDPAVVAQVL
jgi:3-dehydroquinate synthase